jgi:peptidoglycan/LPS O-acetylase OafA/YrhL
MNCPVTAREVRPMTTAASHVRHVPALDGVRALAVLAVLAFHAGLPWAGGGFLGVDVFFVLSGYLITTLLLAEQGRTGRIALRSFWRRRAARLLPGLLLVIAVSTVGARALMPAEDLTRLRGDGLAAVFYVANWRMVLDGDDYFSRTAAPSPFEHTWSLGIEEQFYLVWPLLLTVLVARSASRRTALRRVLAVCAAGVAVSTVLLAEVHRAADPGRAYYGTDTRGASLLVGAGLAVAIASRWPAAAAGEVRLASRAARVALGGAAAIGAAWLVWLVGHTTGGEDRLYRGGLLLVALSVAALLAHVVLVPDGWSARVLSWRPLVLLGVISYGVYLWHWPVYLAVNAGRTGRTGVELFAIRCLVTLLIAVASYLVVERPFRRLLSECRPRRLAAGAVAAFAVVVAALTSTVAPVAQAGVEPLGPGARDGISAVGPVPELDATAAQAEKPHRRQAWRHHPRPGREPVVAVFGDSLAWTLVSYLPEIPGLDVRDRTMLGCGVAREAPYRYFGQLYPHVTKDCRDWPKLWKHAIDVDDPDVAFVFVGRWETMDREVDGRWGHVGQAWFDDYLRSELELAIRTAGGHGARVLLATEPYNRRGETLDGGLFPEDHPERVTAWNALLRDVAAGHRRVRVVDLGARITPAGEFSWTAGGFEVRSDGVHLTPSGVQGWIAPWLVPQLREAVGRQEVAAGNSM